MLPLVFLAHIVELVRRQIRGCFRTKRSGETLLGFCQRAMTLCIRRGEVIAPGSVICVLNCFMYDVSKKKLETYMAGLGKQFFDYKAISLRDYILFDILKRSKCFSMLVC